MLLNGQELWFVDLSSNREEPFRFNVVPVLYHELGHAIGMGHVEGDAAMNPFYQPGGSVGLTAKDNAAARRLY